MTRIATDRRTLLGGLLAGLAKPDAAPAEVVLTGGAALDPLSETPRTLNETLFPGFRQQFIRTEPRMVEGHQAEGAVINTLIGGEGPPIMLIHGFPETHVCWHKVAKDLSARYTVVLPDLRGYGDSSKPGTSPEHVNYSKLAMGADLVQVMRALGFTTFQAVGHDRGGRVLQSMMMENPDTVSRGVVLDIIPSDLMYEHTDSVLATKYFWWFFHIQEEPLPERFIGALPDYYVTSHFDIQNKTPGAVTPAALAEYVRAYSDPAAIHAGCEDFRAAAGIDSRRQADARKTGRKVSQPLLALWGEKGTIGRTFDVVELWKEEFGTVTGHALPCGHLIPEEDPKGLLAALNAFLVT